MARNDEQKQLLRAASGVFARELGSRASGFPAQAGKLLDGGLSAGVPGFLAELSNFLLKQLYTMVAPDNKVTQFFTANQMGGLLHKIAIKLGFSSMWFWIGQMVDRPGKGGSEAFRQRFETGAYSTVGTIVTDIGDSVIGAIEPSAVGARSLRGLSSKTLTSNARTQAQQLGGGLQVPGKPKGPQSKGKSSTGLGGGSV